MTTTLDTARALADDILKASGSGLKHYMPESEKRIVAVAERYLAQVGNGGWSRDISAAPRGRTVPKMVAAGKNADGSPKTKQVDEFIPDFIWAASSCGKVSKSWWIPPTNIRDGRWYGFAEDKKFGPGPIAWKPFVTPDHPDLSDDETKAKRAKALDDLGELDGELLP